MRFRDNFRFRTTVLNYPFKTKKQRIGTTPQEDNSPPYRFWFWWVVLFRGSGPSGELSWWGIVLGIVVLVGNGWGIFLSGGELSSWGVVLEPNKLYRPSDYQIFDCSITKRKYNIVRCGALSCYLYKVRDHKSPKARKNLESWIGPYSFLAFYHFFSYNEVRHIVYRFKA